MPSILRKISFNRTRTTIQSDYEFLASIFGEDNLVKMFSPTSLNLEHSYCSDKITTLSLLYKVAKKYNIEEIFTQDLEKIGSISTSPKYAEFEERYLSLLIADNEFKNIEEALPEHKVYKDSNPDWTFKTKTGSSFHLEVSAISISKTMEDIKSFDGRIPISKIIASHSQPLYFEIVFPDNPRLYDPDPISKKIIEIAQKGGPFPSSSTYGDISIFVDLLSNRKSSPQLMSENLNSMRMLKSTRMHYDKLFYTLATDISLKSIETKINEKKKSNKLDKIGNIWICIFSDDLPAEELINDTSRISKLTSRISASKWLHGLILLDNYHCTEKDWQITYLFLDGL